MTTITNTIPYQVAFAVRKMQLQEQVHILADKMGIFNSNQVSLGIDAFTKSANAIDHSIRVPPFFLFKAQDIPQRFQITSLNDPRISDRQFLSDFKNWINSVLSNAGITSLCRDQDLGFLQQVLEFMRDPATFEKIKEFTIAHELGHVYSTEEKQSAHQQTIIWGILGLILIIATYTLIPLIGLKIIILGAIGSGASLLAMGKNVNAWNKANRPALKEEEFADRKAFEVLQDATGGIAFFDIIRQHNLGIRNASATSQIDSQGNNLQDTKHPPLTTRIAYLRKWQTELLNNAPRNFIHFSGEPIWV